jgi:hypothetical protein
VKPAWAKSSETLSQKNPSQRRSGGEAPSVGHEFKPHYHKKKKKPHLERSDIKRAMIKAAKQNKKFTLLTKYHRSINLKISKRNLL